MLGFGYRNERTELLQRERRLGHSDILVQLIEPITSLRHPFD